MANLDTALERAIALVHEGKTPAEALEHYPQYRKALEPLLEAALQVRQVQSLGLSAAAKTRGRAALEAHMAARPGFHAPGFRWARLASGLAAVGLALVTATTAMAQSALPGDVLHPVKLYSEQVWRSLQTNPVQADLSIAQRRLEELLAVEGNPERVPDAMSAYASSLEVLRRDLESLPNRALSAQTVLHAQREQMQTVLEAAGSTVEEFFTILPTVENLISNNPMQVPLSTPSNPIQLVSPVVPVAPSVSVSVNTASEQPGVSLDVVSKQEGVSLSIGTNLDSALNGIKGLLENLTDK
ncbi:MAG: hypothetical protein KIS88_05610 [Anaerolineales bacterium]|nr:hypothetical protein [Anaerolineales bacterium]